jgi:hypothetical protein
VPLFSPRASRASCQKHLTTWASLNSLQITCGTLILRSRRRHSRWLHHLGVSPVATDRRTRSSRSCRLCDYAEQTPPPSAFETGSPLVLGIIRYSA